MLRPMPSRSPAAPWSFLLSSRARWLWLAVATVLGLWLLALFVVADDEGAKPSFQKAEPPTSSSFEGKSGFLEQRQNVRPSRPLPTVPLRMDDGKSK
jgi:hypothetical protein